MNLHTDTSVYIEAGAYRGPFPSFHNVLRLGWEAGVEGRGGVYMGAQRDLGGGGGSFCDK